MRILYFQWGAKANKMSVGNILNNLNKAGYIYLKRISQFHCVTTKNNFLCYYRFNHPILKVDMRRWCSTYAPCTYPRCTYVTCFTLMILQSVDLIHPSVDVCRITLVWALYSRNKRISLTYVRFLYFCFVLLIVFQLEKTGEEHIDYMIMTNQLRSFNIHTTPLMIASEVSENPSSTFLPLNNIIFFRAVFSFRHFCVSLIYHDTYLPSHYMLPLLL